MGLYGYYSVKAGRAGGLQICLNIQATQRPPEAAEPLGLLSMT
jgi:hypothetical protein